MDLVNKYLAKEYLATGALVIFGTFIIQRLLLKKKVLVLNNY
jgi:hypothetical protein